MSSGIKALLKAEKEAAEVVNDARKYRTNHLKSAKTDAQREIEDYRKQKETELQNYEKEQAGLNTNIEKEANAHIEKELAEIEKQYEDKKGAALQLILDAATQPTAELHINASI